MAKSWTDGSKFGGIRPPLSGIPLPVSPTAETQTTLWGRLKQSAGDSGDPDK